ncbi:hypothetical protein HLRTI_001013 [Halorhabdus tiamatea SARL4B]|uniref:Uncharacterized protein n=1 Tax=Halorhabdus tiamatea SARL4B TaxID=1033806 RepID=U2FA59_9EURY|nr:hypothetical protein [Halorhabdus tiamatea]ERJ06935.1 hypothetical protein HLRTI_001013 [Halorhabdus tiamatea SARL4B]
MELTKRSDDQKRRKQRGRGPDRRLGDDDRGRVPFAIVGVVLLLTSVAFVGHVLPQSTVTPDVDASVAIAQTEGVTQSAIRTGAKRGIEAAAARPVTQASDTAWGTALAANSTDSTSSASTAEGALPSGAFRRYLAAMIYLEVESTVERAGQQVGDVRTNVSVPSIETPADLRAAIDRVSLSTAAEGVLTVTIPNVTIRARSGNRTLEHRETAMTVSIATPIAQLHDRVERFEDALAAGVTERGLTQRFNARIYALGWARGYAQNYQAPIVQVIANRHVQPALNDAIYRTQRDVFGAADPELQDANRLGWTCMALKDGGSMFDEYMGSNDVSYGNTTFTGDELVFERSNGTLSASVPTDGASTAEALCSGAELALGDQITGELPAAPGTRDLLGQAPGMNATETIGVNQTSYVPFARMAAPDGDRSIENVIDRIYTIDGRANTNTRVVDPLELSGTATCTNATDERGTCANGTCANATRGTYTISNGRTVDGAQFTERTTRPEDYYEARSTVEVSVSKYKRCPPGQDNALIDTDTMTVDVRTQFGEADANPNAEIDGVNPISIGDDKYDRGAAVSGLPADFRNYAGSESIVTESLLGDEPNPEAHAAWVKSALPNRITTEADITGPIAEQLNVQKRVTLDHDRFLDAKLAAAIASDLTEMRRAAADITYEFSRTDLLERGEKSPFTRLIEKTETTLTERYLDRAEPYDSVGQKAIYEARYAYLQALLAELETVESGHEKAVGGIDDKLDGADLSLEKALTFLQEGVSADEPDPVPMNSSNLTGTVTYEVSGAPTYLVAENLTKRDVPAIPAGAEFTPLAMRNEELLDSPIDDIANGLVSNVLDAINLGGSDATIPLKTAGDVLLAGNLAADVEDDPITNRSFETSLAALEDTVDESLSTFGETVADGTVKQLYPHDAAACVVAEDAARGRRGPSCADRYGDSLVATITAAHDEIERRADEVIAGYDTTGERAVAIGKGTRLRRSSRRSPTRSTRRRIDPARSPRPTTPNSGPTSSSRRSGLRSRTPARSPSISRTDNTSPRSRRLSKPRSETWLPAWSRIGSATSRNGPAIASATRWRRGAVRGRVS